MDAQDSVSGPAPSWFRTLSARPGPVGSSEPLLGDLDFAAGHRHPRAGDHAVAVGVEAAHLVPDLLHVHPLVVVGGHRERTTV